MVRFRWPVSLLFGTVLVVLLVFPANAGSVRVASCATIINSLDADWIATQILLDRRGVAHEANPIIRLVGAAPYFGALILAAGRTCRETPHWRWIAAGVWLIQTWAVNTHGATVRPPLLIFTIQWY